MEVYYYWRPGEIPKTIFFIFIISNDYGPSSLKKKKVFCIFLTLNWSQFQKTKHNSKHKIPVVPSSQKESDRQEEKNSMNTSSKKIVKSNLIVMVCG